MIEKELRNFNWYLDRMPLYFKGSFGITEHFKILCDLLGTLDDLQDDTIKYLDIFSKDFVPNSVILDMIGAIYGLSRTLCPKYIYNNGIVENTNKINITLSDEEFVIYIKCQIIKNNYNGTFENVNNLYSNIKDINNVQIFFTHSDNEGNALNPAECAVYTTIDVSDNNFNLICLFINGLLTLETVGINYHYYFSNAPYAKWYESGDIQNINKWDYGWWS